MRKNPNIGTLYKYKPIGGKIMRNKKLVGLLLALGMLSAPTLLVGQGIVAKADVLDAMDQSFMEFLLSDTTYHGEVTYTHTPLYNEDLEISGRQYNFTIGETSGYALLVEIQSGDKTFYEIEELFYNAQSPFAECEGLPVFITHRTYLDYKDNAFYDIVDDTLLSEETVNEYAYIGFGYCGAWDFAEQYETVSYATKSVSSYSIQYDLPNYFGPVGTTCASTAGTIAVAYYDRFYENLIPNFQVYTPFGNRIVYKSISQAASNVANELYDLMGGEREHQGTTFSEFQNGMATYVSNKGYTYSTTSVFTNGSFDFEKYKTSVQNGKPVALFLNGFAFKTDLTTTDNVDTIKNDYSNTAHVVMACGYQQHQYYNTSGQEIDNRIYLKVATALTTYQIGYLNVSSALTVIDHAISIEIS